MLLFIFTLLFTYCCSEPTESNITDTEIIPLKMGNNWDYIRTVYDSAGIVQYTENINYLVIRDTIIHYERWFGLTNTPASIYYTNKYNGYWLYRKKVPNYFPNDTSFLIYKYPANVGDIYNGFGYQREVVAVNKLISVPAGSFNTIHYVDTFLPPNNYLQESFEIFVARGIGIVKRMQIGRKYDGTNFVVYAEELENYTVN